MMTDAARIAGASPSLWLAVIRFDQLPRIEVGRWWAPLVWGCASALLWLVTWSLAQGPLEGVGAGSAVLGMVCTIACAAMAVVRFDRPCTRGLWSQVKRATLFGLPHVPVAVVGHLYIWQTAGPSLVLLGFYLASFPAMTVLLAGWVRSRLPKVRLALVLPLVWVSVEVVRGEWLLGGYPWYLAGHAASPGPAAAFIGSYGCSLVMVAVATLLAELLMGLIRFRWWAVIALVAGFVVAGVLGANAPAAKGTLLRVAVVQTNLAQSNKLAWPMAQRVKTHRHWLDLSLQAARQANPPGLIVWPETMFAGAALNTEAVAAQRAAGLRYAIDRSDGGTGNEGAELSATFFADSLLETQNQSAIPWLVGSVAIEGLRYTSEGGRVRTESVSRYNSVMMVDNGVVAAKRYDKMALMAFGEYIPVVYRWPQLQQSLVRLGAQGMSFDLSFGTTPTVFEVPNPATGTRVRIVTPICFEVCNADLCRGLVFERGGAARRADLLVNATNDGWFYGSNFNRRMHLLQARWRCAELGTPMVRAANTGISCVIDASGTVLLGDLHAGGQPGMQMAERVMTVDVPLPDQGGGGTAYARYGYLLKYLVLAASSALLLSATMTRFSPITPPSQPAG